MKRNGVLTIFDPVLIAATKLKIAADETLISGSERDQTAFT